MPGSVYFLGRRRVQHKAVGPLPQDIDDFPFKEGREILSLVTDDVRSVVPPVYLGFLKLQKCLFKDPVEVKLIVCLEPCKVMMVGIPDLFRIFLLASSENTDFLETPADGLGIIIRTVRPD